MSEFRRILKCYATLISCAIIAVGAASCTENDSESGEGGGNGVKGISISPKLASIKIGESQNLTVTIEPESAADKSYTLTSSNPAVATVENDVVTALAAGSTNIIAKCGNFTAVCQVIVTSTDVAVTGLSVSPESASLDIGKTQALTISVTPAEATDKTYSVVSSDPNVASVKDDIITGVGVGTATITVTTNDGGYVKTCDVTVSEPFDGIVATSAGAYYPGDQYQTGSDCVFLTLMTGAVVTYQNDEGFDVLEGEGTALWIELNCTKTGATSIPAGTYNVLPEDYQEGDSQDFTFLADTDMGAWGVIGTFIYTLEGEATEPVYTMVDGGKVDISVSGDIYTVIAEVTVGGVAHNFKYVGKIPNAAENGGGGGGSEYEEIVVTGLTQGEMDYWGGDAYGNTGTDYANWVIYLAGEGFDLASLDGAGPMVQIEVNTTATATREIPSGTYTVFTDIVPEAFVPFSAVPGFSQPSSQGDGDVYNGTWYFNAALEPTYGATAGTVKIEKGADGNYTIEFEFTDDDFKGKFSGSYTGPLGYYDGTAQNAGASIMRAGRRAADKTAFSPRSRRVAFRK